MDISPFQIPEMGERRKPGFLVHQELATWALVMLRRDLYIQ
jgi:hypothetical protein